MESPAKPIRHAEYLSGSMGSADQGRLGSITRFQLYDLSTGPGQQKDIADRFPEVVNRLTEQLLEINADVLKEAPDWKPNKSTRSSTTRPKSQPTPHDGADAP